MFSTGLARRFPHSWRVRLTKILETLATCYMAYRLRGSVREAREIEAIAGRRVAILGLFRSRVGIGTAADLLATELELEGAVVAKIDVSVALNRAPNVVRNDVSHIGALAESKFDVIVLHVNPPEFAHLRLMLPSAVTDGSLLVGFFAWELDRAPAGWRGSAACCNQIWVPSRFVAQALGKTFPETRPKLRVREHPVNLKPFPRRSPDARRAARERLGIGQDIFLAVTSFSFYSTLARKNPVGAIEAFRKAASDAVPVIHLVRCLDFDAFPNAMQPLEEAASGDDRVRLARIGRETSSIEDAYLAADVYLSLHRAEGFGLNLAEALLVGLPVVATQWGISESITSHPNFFGVPSRLVPVVDPQHTYDRVPGACWAEPDVEFAAAKLRLLMLAAHPGTEATRSNGT